MYTLTAVHMHQSHTLMIKAGNFYHCFIDIGKTRAVSERHNREGGLHTIYFSKYKVQALGGWSNLIFCSYLKPGGPSNVAISIDTRGLLKLTKT